MSLEEVLKNIKSPTRETYEVKISIPELSFLGAKEQPDYALLEITYYPGKTVIELKSLKRYIHGFRNQLKSYERLINTIYNDLMDVYEPRRLILEMHTKPRGGITSHLKVDSDWREKQP